MENIDSFIENCKWVLVEADNEVREHEYIDREWTDEFMFDEFGLEIRKEGESEFYCGAAIYFEYNDYIYWHINKTRIGRFKKEIIENKEPKLLLKQVSPYRDCDGCGKKFDRAFLKSGLCMNCRTDTISKEDKQKVKRARVASCWKCKKPVGGKNLKQKWIRELNQQRFLCAECISQLPVSTRSGNPAEYKFPIQRKEKIGEILETSQKIFMGNPKPCFYCDCELFKFYGNGKLRCNNCNKEYQI